MTDESKKKLADDLRKKAESLSEALEKMHNAGLMISASAYCIGDVKPINGIKEFKINRIYYTKNV